MPERKKVLMLATTAAMIEQFNKQNILILCDMGYEVHVVGNFDEGNPISNERLDEFKKWLESLDCKWFNNVSTRKPYDVVHNYRAYRSVLKLINNYKYSFIHCHNPIGAVIGRLAGHKTHTRVVYTAHGFHFYKGSQLLNWIVYYPIEKILSKYTDTLIVINSEDYELAKKRFTMTNLEYVRGIGIDIEKYSCQKAIRNKKRKELKVSDDEKVFLCVGELIPRKNYLRMIKAFSMIENDKIRVLICGKGKSERKLTHEINKLELQKEIELLGFRTDIGELLDACDYFIFPSLQEGLSVALMEAMAARVPIICSKIRGNIDLINNNRYLFDPYNVSDIRDKIIDVLNNDYSDLEENYISVQKCRKENVLTKMEQIYNRF